MNLSSWSEQALHAANSSATVMGAVAALLSVVAILVVYFTSSELHARMQARRSPSVASPPDSVSPIGAAQKGADAPRERKQAQLSAFEKELSMVRKEKDATAMRLSQVDAELAKARLAADAKEARLSQLQHELDDLRRATDLKNARVAELEGQLTRAHRTEEAKNAQVADLQKQLSVSRAAEEAGASRLNAAQADLTEARESAQAADARTKEPSGGPGVRTLSPTQREKFLAAVRGMAAGKVIVSAFFDNNETHAFGAELIGLLKQAGFGVVEATPVNFFTTSRPSSGLRIGCVDMNNAPPHLLTIRKALAAAGFDAPDTTVINADEPDVVEIQITPRQ